jgi:hypothetical protein
MKIGKYKSRQIERFAEEKIGRSKDWLTERYA